MELLPYQNHQDLNAMLDLLSEGRKANNGSYYVHRGDLQWWLFYVNPPQDSMIYLLKEDGRLRGWILLSLNANAFDVYVTPELRDTPREYEMLAWAVEQMPVREKIYTVWIAEDDAPRIHWLAENGFAEESECQFLMKRDISAGLNPPALPEGFALRSSRGTEEDARLRSVASYAAFESSKPFEEYVARTWKFMQSSAYVPEHNIFVTAKDGRVAAFCVIWTDELNKVGLFEPVGAHPDFQRKGLGKCLLYEGLQRLKSAGMEEALVCVESDNPAAVRLYEAVGFQSVKKLMTFTKRKKT